jgi:hypothetical protein
MPPRNQRQKTQIRQDFPQAESGDRIEGPATAANPARAAAALLADLQAISERSTARLQGRSVMTEANLYNEDGLPA